MQIDERPVLARSTNLIANKQSAVTYDRRMQYISTHKEEKNKHLLLISSAIFVELEFQ